MPYLTQARGRGFTVINYEHISIMSLCPHSENPKEGTLYIYGSDFGNHYSLTGNITTLSDYVSDWQEWIDSKRLYGERNERR